MAFPEGFSGAWDWHPDRTKVELFVKKLDSSIPSVMTWEMSIS
jgi:hypothetical protein